MTEAVRSGRRSARRLVFCLGVVLWAWGVAAGAAAAPFSFAWLSDTHVGGSTGAEDLQAAVRDINALTNLSFVLVSGDVTEYGSLEQLTLAKRILEGVRIPVHVIPGNHDTKWSESGATDFPRLWGADRFVFEQDGIRFIGLHQGPVMKMGDGHWAPQDVRWLEGVLAGLQPADQPIVFVTHYPLDDGIDNWYVVLDLLKRHNIQAILCGHGHSNRKLQFEGAPGVMGRSNLRARDAVGGFNIVEVAGGRMTFSEHTHGDGTREAWHSVALQRHDFAGDTHRYPRPDFSVNRRFAAVEEQWVFQTGYTVASTPAVTAEEAVVGDASGTVYALGLRSGDVRWKFKAGNAVFSTPAVARGRVVFASTDGSVYALRAKDGREEWRYPTKRPIVASPAIAHPSLLGRQVVLIGSSEGKMRALDLRTGKRVWEFDGLGGFVETQPLVYQGKAIFGAWDEHLYALDVKTGSLGWRWQGDRMGTLLSPAACWPVGAQGKVVIVAPDRRMTALEAATGRQVWRTADYAVRESLGLSEDGKRLYVRAMNDRFYAFDTAAKEPREVWETNAGFGYDINSAMLVEKNGVVFYATKNGLLFALDARTGAVKWQHRLSVGIVNTVAPLSATDVITTDFDGNAKRIAARN